MAGPVKHGTFFCAGCFRVNAPGHPGAAPPPRAPVKTLPLFPAALLLLAGSWPVSSLAIETLKAPEGKATPVLPANPAVAKTYLLRASDVIRVDVVDDPKASHEYKIGVDGKIRPVYLKASIPLAGLSAAAAEEVLGRAYVGEGIFSKPQISVSVKEYTEQRINFLGQVNHPGPVSIPPEKELSLVTAFSQAGGHTRNASRYCTITRLLPNGKSTAIRLDLRGAVEDAKKDIMLQDGDTVFMGESLLGNDWQ